MRRELWWQTNAGDRIVSKQRNVVPSWAGARLKHTERDYTYCLENARIDGKKRRSERASGLRGRHDTLYDDCNDDNDHADEGERAGFCKLRPQVNTPLESSRGEVEQAETVTTYLRDVSVQSQRKTDP